MTMEQKGDMNVIEEVSLDPERPVKTIRVGSKLMGKKKA